MKNTLTRVKTFGDKVITKFTNNEIWKENTLYSWVAKKIIVVKILVMTFLKN